MQDAHACVHKHRNATTQCVPFVSYVFACSFLVHYNFLINSSKTLQFYISLFFIFFALYQTLVLNASRSLKLFKATAHEVLPHRITLFSTWKENMFQQVILTKRFLVKILLMYSIRACSGFPIQNSYFIVIITTAHVVGTFWCYVCFHLKERGKT